MTSASSRGIRCERIRLAAWPYHAILRNLAVIAVALHSLPDDLTQAHPDFPWPVIAGLRNVAVREYVRVDADVVTDIFDNHLGALADELY